MVSRADFSRIHPFLPIPLPKSKLKYFSTYNIKPDIKLLIFYKVIKS